MKPYVFVGSSRSETFEDAVNDAISDGYVPQGGISVQTWGDEQNGYEVRYMQAMYKKPTKTAKPKSSKDDYSEGFLEAWKLYPKRSGSNSKQKAFRAWCTRLTQNKTLLDCDMVSGVIRYAEYCEVMGVDPVWVMMTATFFGPDKHYENDWSFDAPEKTLPTKNDDLEQFAIKLGMDEPRPGTGESWAAYRARIERAMK